MEHKCYDKYSIWVYINYEKDNSKATQIVTFDPNCYTATSQILAELGKLDYVRDRYDFIASVEVYFSNGILDTCYPSQDQSEWKITRSLVEDPDKATFQEYTKKGAVEWQWL